MVLPVVSSIVMIVAGVTTPGQVANDLLDKLAKAPDEETAKGLEEQVWDAWMTSGSPVTDILMRRAVEALEEEKFDLGREMLDRVVMIQPQWSEGWYRRASLFYKDGKYDEAIADLEMALQKEPRHFGAWIGLATIFESIERPKAALLACRKALGIHPHFAAAKQCEKRLIPKVDGRSL